MKNEMLALILAGGQGTRLGKLTQSIAKPAVQFGGRYRIIDFGLSNCANSGINNVGVITQYQPLALNNQFFNLTQLAKVIVGLKVPATLFIKTLSISIASILNMF